MMTLKEMLKDYNVDLDTLSIIRIDHEMEPRQDTYTVIMHDYEPKRNQEKPVDCRCGGKVLTDYAETQPFYQISCARCGVSLGQMNIRGGKKRAINAWNKIMK